ncbi:hypothetical protein FG469_004423 [Yersinia enterocolitica]|nr:hypothetical protein [Yersinia enterocolitica]
MLSNVCKERLEYLASLKGHTGQAVTVCRVELSDISTELLSLREQLAEKEERLCRLRTSLEIEMKGHEAAERQLAELKALPPIGQIVLGDYDSDGIRPARVVCLHDQADWDNFQDGTLLYLEAKLSEE